MGIREYWLHDILYYFSAGFVKQKKPYTHLILVTYYVIRYISIS